MSPTYSLISCTCPQLVDQQFTPRRRLFSQHRRSEPVLNVPAPPHRLYKHMCGITHKKKPHHPELQKSCRSKMDSWSDSHASAGLSAPLSARKMALSRVSLTSCSLTSLWCSNVCSASTLRGVLKWRRSHFPAKKKDNATPAQLAGYGWKLHVLLQGRDALNLKEAFPGWFWLFKRGSPVLSGRWS